MDAVAPFSWGNEQLYAENEDGTNGARPYKLNIDISHTHTVTADGSVSLTGDTETRPINFTVRLWTRIA